MHLHRSRQTYGCAFRIVNTPHIYNSNGMNVSCNGISVSANTWEQHRHNRYDIACCEGSCTTYRTGSMIFLVGTPPGPFFHFGSQRCAGILYARRSIIFLVGTPVHSHLHPHSCLISEECLSSLNALILFLSF